MTASRKKITKAQFHAINRAIKNHKADGTYNSDRIANGFDVSPSTVRTIARTGTWPKFIEHKQKRRNHAKSVQTRLSVSINGQGVHSQPIAVRTAPSLPTTATPKQRTITEELQELAEAPVTSEELSNALRPLRKRIENIETHLRKSFWRRFRG